MVKVEKLAKWVETLSSEEKQKLYEDMDKAVTIVASIYGDSSFDTKALEILLSDRDYALKQKVLIETQIKENEQEIARLKAENDTLISRLDATIIMTGKPQTTFDDEIAFYTKKMQERLQERLKAQKALKDAVLSRDKFTVQEVNTLVEMAKDTDAKPKKKG